MPSQAENLKVIVSEMSEPVAPISGVQIVLNDLTENIPTES
jgi:hypothetical protein